MYEMNMENQENDSGAERELRLLIHQSIVGGVSLIIVSIVIIVTIIIVTIVIIIITIIMIR